MSKFVLRDYQQQASDIAVDFFRSKAKGNGIIIAPTGCHSKGYGIVMGDGSVRKVEDIRIGDVLHGPNGNRTVLSLHHGVDDMYKIIPIKGEPFIVNGGHVLHLHKTNE